MTKLQKVWHTVHRNILSTSLKHGLETIIWELETENNNQKKTANLYCF